MGAAIARKRPIVSLVDARTELRVVVGVVVWTLELRGSIIKPADVFLGVLSAVAIDLGATVNVPGIIKGCIVVAPTISDSITTRGNQAVVRS